MVDLTETYMDLVCDLTQELWRPLFHQSTNGEFARWTRDDASHVCSLYVDLNADGVATNLGLQLVRTSDPLAAGIVWLAGKHGVPLLPREPGWAQGKEATARPH